jgi:HK97 family phage prohead protease
MTTLKIDTKFVDFDFKATKDGKIEGYGSLFGIVDNGGDIVVKGAYAASLARRNSRQEKVKMLWQHDPAQPIGVWDEVIEDDKGLIVKGRILDQVAKGREAKALMEAGALDGLSIGYRTIRADYKDSGERQLLEVDLWEVSLVTFPMLPEARASVKLEGLEEVKEKLVAGDRLTVRQFEALAKGLGLSNAQAERAARVHLKGQGEPAEAAKEGEELIQFLSALRG